MNDSNMYERQLEEWYEQYSGQIFRYIFIMVGERQLARDLMQETFIKAFKSMKDFRGEASPKTWLHHIARNVTLDNQRKKRPVQYILESFAPIPSKELTPQEVVELGEEMEQLYIALNQLKKDYREVIVLRKIREFSTKETATILGWKESRVKTMLFRGIEELRNKMGREGLAHEKVE